MRRGFISDFRCLTDNLRRMPVAWWKRSLSPFWRLGSLQSCQSLLAGLRSAPMAVGVKEGGSVRLESSPAWPFANSIICTHSCSEGWPRWCAVVFLSQIKRTLERGPARPPSPSVPSPSSTSFTVPDGPPPSARGLDHMQQTVRPCTVYLDTPVPLKQTHAGQLRPQKPHYDAGDWLRPGGIADERAHALILLASRRLLEALRCVFLEIWSCKGVISRGGWPPGGGGLMSWCKGQCEDLGRSSLGGLGLALHC